MDITIYVGEKMTEEIKGTSNPSLDGLLNDKNDLDIHIKPDIFIELLRVFNIGKEFSPIAGEFLAPRNIRIRVKDSSGDSFAVFTGTKEDSEFTEKAGYIIIDQSEILSFIGKYTDSNELGIVAEENQRIIFSDENGNRDEIVPLDKSQVTIIPLGKMPHFNEEGWFCWAAKEKDGSYKTDDNGDRVYSPAKTKIVIDSKELQKCMTDMKSSKRDYVELHFGKDGSYSKSGHLGKEKSNHTSTTKLNCEVEGGDLNIILQHVFVDMIKTLSGDVDIFGTDGVPGIVIRKGFDYGTLVFVATQPKEVR